MDEYETALITPPDLPPGIYRDHAVVVTGLFRELGANDQPVEAAFLCRYNGDLLDSFGWVHPPMLADPDFPLGRIAAEPVAGAP